MASKAGEAAAAADGALAALDRGVQRLLSRLSGSGADVGVRMDALLDRLLEYCHRRFPELERLVWAWADTIFAPKVVVRQYLIAIAIEVGLFSYHLGSR